jgi:hypothetical protein
MLDGLRQGLVSYALPRDCRLVAALAFVGVGGGGIDAALNTYAATTHGPRTLSCTSVTASAPPSG